MGVELESSTGYYGAIIPPPVVRNDRFSISEQPTPGEWRTAPLWGVADSAPYLHDGRAETLREAIELHGGEAVDVTARFKERPAQDQEAVIAFLKTLRAPSLPRTRTPSRRDECPLVMILVCGCGMRLKAAGAYPGRLGKCPACGAPLRVPDLAPPPPAHRPMTRSQSDRAEPRPSAARSSTFVACPGRSGAASSRRDAASRGDWNGLLPVPARPETRLRDSLLYPFWGVTGLALLVFLPPALWLTSLPALGILAVASSLPGPVRLAGVFGFLPATFAFRAGLGLSSCWSWAGC